MKSTGIALWSAVVNECRLRGADTPSKISRIIGMSEPLVIAHQWRGFAKIETAAKVIERLGGNLTIAASFPPIAHATPNPEPPQDGTECPPSS